jgi:hypothetical protein
LLNENPSSEKKLIVFSRSFTARLTNNFVFIKMIYF